MSFCVAGVAGRDILTCLQMVSKVVLCDRRNPAARFSEYGFPFSWHVQHFGRVHVHFAWQAQQFRRVVLRVFFANCIVRAASSGDNVQIAWQAWCIARMSFCMAGAVFCADPLCVDVNFACHAQSFGHSTLYTLHSILYTTRLTL